jgi:hypothetical protein
MVKWLPVQTAAKMLKVSRQRVYVLVQEGKLASRVVDGVVLVGLDAILARVRAQLLLRETE